MSRLLLPLLLLVSFAPLRQEPAPREPVTVFLVRHAETTRVDGERVLDEEGRARAEDLARLLGHAGVTHLYSSPYPRTRQTLAPLAAHTELEVQEVSPREAGRQVELLRALPPGSVAVVAGHSNTVPGLVTALGGGAVGGLTDSPYGKLIAEDQHDRLFVVTLPGVSGAAVSTLELRVGE